MMIMMSMAYFLNKFATYINTVWGKAAVVSAVGGRAALVKAACVCRGLHVHTAA